MSSTRLALALLVFFLLPAAALAETYSDLEIRVTADGRASVAGSSNVALADFPLSDEISGVSDALTSKRGKVWTFNITSNGSIDVSVIKVWLPQGAAVSAVRSLQTSTISAGESILITFVGRNEPVQIAIQYTLESTDALASERQSRLGWWGLAAAVIVCLIGLATYGKRLLRTLRPGAAINEERFAVLKPTLNETQLRIIEALLAAGGAATQNKIHHATGIPKASLSRNVDILARKQVLEKVSGGYTNSISIAADLRQK